MPYGTPGEALPKRPGGIQAPGRAVFPRHGTAMPVCGGRGESEGLHTGIGGSPCSGEHIRQRRHGPVDQHSGLEGRACRKSAIRDKSSQSKAEIDRLRALLAKATSAASTMEKNAGTLARAELAQATFDDLLAESDELARNAQTFLVDFDRQIEELNSDTAALKNKAMDIPDADDIKKERAAREHSLRETYRAIEAIRQEERTLRETLGSVNETIRRIETAKKRDRHRVRHHHVPQQRDFTLGHPGGGLRRQRHHSA